MADSSWINLIPHQEGVMELSLNGAPVNALTPDKLFGFRGVLQALGADDTVRAILLTSPLKVFSAGLNLKEAQHYDAAAQNAIVDGLNQGFLAQFECPKPVICAVNGAAIAGGLFFVLASDHRIAVPRAQFGLAEVRVGVGFPLGPLEIARAALSATQMRRLMLRGQPIDAISAERAGIVDEIVEPADLVSTAQARAAEFAAIPPQAYADVKHQTRGSVIVQIKAGLAKKEPAWFTAETRDAMAKMIG